ncbi:MAG: hypothetical protein ACT4PS_13255 [Betaproteobacteria bacterium]
MAVDTEPDQRARRQRPEQQTAGAGSAAARGDSIGETGRAQAEAVWNDAKASVRSVLNERQRSTAAELHDFANALRGAARNIDQRGPVVRVAEQAADGLEQLSGKLRSKDLDGLIHDVESFARSQPAVFLGMAVAAGFLAVRFLKSTGPDRAARPEAGPTGFTPAGPRPDLDAMADTTPAFDHDPRRT